MNPRIADLVEDNDTLTFKMSDVNVSVANGLRRTITSDINTICFITTPHSENLSVFHTNTTRMNNELLKQRLSCIPIHISESEFPIEDYMVEINVQNDTEYVMYVTTQDFKIKNTITDKYLTENMVQQIFPPNKITGDFIDLVRLRPKINEQSEPEELHITCKFSISNAKHNSMFNVVSCCSYGYTQDAVEINKQWTLKEKELNKTHNKEQIAYIKKDWLLLDAQRYTVPNSFDFTIETLGIFENITLVNKACNIIIQKLTIFSEQIQNNGSLIKKSPTTVPYSFDILLENEDYTLGKVIEWFMYSTYFLGDETLSFCGFRKDHPHDTHSTLRVAYKEDTEKITLIQHIISATNEAKQIYEKIQREFNSEKEIIGTTETKSSTPV
jgi:DNA-directed RNA polymerase subunit L